MWYLIIGADVDHSLAARKSARPAHLARLQQLNDAGRLKLADDGMRILTLLVGNRQDARLHGRQPGRKGARIVLD